MPIDNRSDRPVYQQIADELRARIHRGVYAPGSQLPSESDLIQEFGGTRVTVRRGLAVLENEGLAQVVRGRGVFVPEPPPVLALRTSRFSRAARNAGKGALAAEAEALGLPWRSEHIGEPEVIDLPANIAVVLGEDRGAVCRRRMWVNDLPTQLADSYMPESIDTLTGWSSGAQAPGGIYGLLEQHGYPVVRFREELAGRRATADEATALQLPTGAPVITLVRHAITTSGAVVEYFDSVAAADKHRYVYEFDAPED
ncbi:MAG: GntR family transcriptional regulator [Solirubrobacteraceae bacterium]